MANMPLTLHGKHSESLIVSYATFDGYRVAVMESIDSEMGCLYARRLVESWNMPAEAEQRLSSWLAARPEICLLANASESSFDLTPAQCRALSRVLKRRMPKGFRYPCSTRPRKTGPGSRSVQHIDFHARFIKMLDECSSNRVKLYGR